MSGQLAIDHLRYIKAKCGAEGYQAFLSIPDGALGPTTCNNCGGEGEITVTFAKEGLGMPVMWRGGKRYQIMDHAVFPCPVCKADRSGRINLMLKASGVPDHEWGWDIHYIKDKPGKEIAYRSACEILSQSPMPTGFHLIYGDYGMGKSGLMKSLVVALVKAGVPAIYVNAADILAQIRASFSHNSPETEIDILSNYTEIRFLAVDEVDIIGNTDWSLSTLRTLVDKRYEGRSVNCTMLGTNRPPDQLWPYLASRCEDGYRIPIGGESLRGAGADQPPVNPLDWAREH